MWKSENPHGSSGGTQEDEIGNTKFEIRKSEKQVEMTEKVCPTLSKAKTEGVSHPGENKIKIV